MKRIKKRRSLKLRKRGTSRPTPGEYIEMECKLGFIPRGVYRVEGFTENLLRYSLGEINGGADLSTLNILRRHLPPPVDMLGAEIKFIDFQLQRCGCEECEKLLAEKRLQQAVGPVETVTMH
ncbi:hypothetical protein OAO01_01955 [Oligoflexia bacterium]|nr:hypothetical protein [Oligoflexia bacterium]